METVVFYPNGNARVDGTFKNAAEAKELRKEITTIAEAQQIAAANSPF